MEDTITAASRVKTFDDKTDLLRDTENAFYGGGAAPIPTPTPSPTPAPQSTFDTSTLIFNPNIPEPPNPNAYNFFKNPIVNDQKTSMFYG